VSRTRGPALQKPGAKRSLTLALVGVVGLGPVVLPRQAAAAPDEQDREAKALYQQGKYREAAELYTKLRDERQQPKYLCNLGLCYAKMGHLEPAIETIQLCLGTATLVPGIRTDYENLLKRLEAQRAQAAGAANAPAAVPPPVDVALVPVPEAAPGYDPAQTGVPPGTPPGWGAPAASMAEAPAYPDPNAAYGYGYPTAPPPGYDPAAMNQPAARATDRQPAPSGKKRLPFGSYVTGAIGLVGTGMGIALVLHGQAVQQELDGSHGSAADREVLQNDKSRTRSGAIAAFVIGGLGLASSVVWALVAPTYVKPTIAGKSLDVAVGPQSVTVAGRF
jgi:hypothetical protein